MKDYAGKCGDLASEAKSFGKEVGAPSEDSVRLGGDVRRLHIFCNEMLESYSGIRYVRCGLGVSL